MGDFSSINTNIGMGSPMNKVWLKNYSHLFAGRLWNKWKQTYSRSKNKSNQHDSLSRNNTYTPSAEWKARLLKDSDKCSKSGRANGKCNLPFRKMKFLRSEKDPSDHSIILPLDTKWLETTASLLKSLKRGMDRLGGKDCILL